MKVKELFKKAGVAYTVTGGELPERCEVSEVTADSRRAGPGSLFVALPGVRVDGHDFLAAAGEKGCRVVLTNRGRRLPAGPAPSQRQRLPHLATLATLTTLITIDTLDTRAAFGRLCAALRGFPAREMVMIGITGTNGKTTCSYLLEELIRRSGGRPGVIGTVNYRYGNRVLLAPHTTPEAESLQRLLREMADAGVSHVIMEVSSHALEQQRVAGIDFDVALFTNLSHEHLDYHGDMATYFAGKKKLFDHHLKPGGAAVVMAGPAGGPGEEDIWNRRLVEELLSRCIPSAAARPASGQLRLLRCGVDGRELRLLARRSTLAGLEAELQDAATGRWRLRSSLVGDFNLDNLLGVAGIGLALGLAPETIAAALAAAPPPPGRLESFRGRRGVEVLVDYAHTPDALGHVLKSLRGLTPGRLVVLFGCGGDRDRAKRPLMGEIAARLADIVLLTSDNPRSEDPAAIMADIRRGLERAGARRGRLENLLSSPTPVPQPITLADSRAPIACRGFDLLVSRRQAIRDAIYFARPGDVVLICGKGHETSQIIGDRRLLFDDRQEVREQLAVLPRTG